MSRCHSWTGCRALGQHSGDVQGPGGKACPGPDDAPLLLIAPAVSSGGPCLMLAATPALQAQAPSPLFGRFMQIGRFFFFYFFFIFLVPCCCCSTVPQIAEVLRTGVCVRSCGTRVPAGRVLRRARMQRGDVPRGKGGKKPIKAEDGEVKVLSWAIPPHHASKDEHWCPVGTGLSPAWARMCPHRRAGWGSGCQSGLCSSPQPSRQHPPCHKAAYLQPPTREHLGSEARHFQREQNAAYFSVF